MSSFFDSGFVPSDSILKFKADVLARQREKSSSSAPTTSASTVDDASLRPLLDLWDLHQGDIPAIFAALGDNPGKALKYPPKDGHDFASRVRVIFTISHSPLDGDFHGRVCWKTCSTWAATTHTLT